jgi:hypothetical protein
MGGEPGNPDIKGWVKTEGLPEGTELFNQDREAPHLSFGGAGTYWAGVMGCRTSLPALGPSRYRHVAIGEPRSGTHTPSLVSLPPLECL